MSLLAKKSGFQGQKHWPPKFHIKLRNTRPPPPYLGDIPKKYQFFTASHGLAQYIRSSGGKKNSRRRSGGNKEWGTVFYLKHQSSIVLLETQATSKPLHATCHNDNDTTMVRYAYYASRLDNSFMDHHLSRLFTTHSLPARLFALQASVSFQLWPIQAHSPKEMT